MMKAKFELGAMVKDTLSGVEGKIEKITFSTDSRPEYCLIREGVSHDGKIWEPVWIYESRLV
jgi:hypothetical protein